ncbi:uncharacterized protein LOC108044083 [Drosophila rhopaloa]|uniref:Uncharacterized protein LOC108044083 n=1 Tax=Drosophila rhopaloa TaxID=1041015 RepID=A0A6P4EZI9_DRORH|nr:uncharacterized protein LOC108044083 [Drosophila rhopaloa]
MDAVVLEYVVKADAEKRETKKKIADLEKELKDEKDPIRSKTIEQQIEELKKEEVEAFKRNQAVMTMYANTANFGTCMGIIRNF